MELIITDKGRDLISKLIEGNEVINFTKIKTSDYDYSGTDLRKITDLNNIKQEATISSIEKINKTHVEVIGIINNNNLHEGYYVKAVGLYAMNLNKEEILYGVSIPDKYPDYMPAFENKTLSAISYKLITKVENSEQINIELNPEGVPNITQFNDLKEVVIETEKFISEHIKNGILNEDGSHGLKYNEDESKLKYKKDGVWHDITTGQNAEEELNNHKIGSVLDNDGVHGVKYDEGIKNIAIQKGMQWSPIEPHAKDIELIKYVLCEKIVDNLFTIELEDVQVEGGCYDYANKKYYINKGDE